MGIYHAEIANGTYVRLRHNPPDEHSVAFEASPGGSLPEWLTNQVQAGGDCTISFSFGPAPSQPATQGAEEATGAGASATGA